LPIGAGHQRRSDAAFDQVATLRDVTGEEVEHAANAGNALQVRMREAALEGHGPVVEGRAQALQRRIGIR
jgi:hypothetical protein